MQLKVIPMNAPEPIPISDVPYGTPVKMGNKWFIRVGHDEKWKFYLGVGYALVLDPASGTIHGYSPTQPAIVGQSAKVEIAEYHGGTSMPRTGRPRKENYVQLAIDSLATTERYIKRIPIIADARVGILREAVEMLVGLVERLEIEIESANRQVVAA